jgi:hypothetical protein
MALVDELVTSVLLVTADCSVNLLARHRPFLVFLGFSFFSFTLFAGVFVELGLPVLFVLYLLILILILLVLLWFGLLLMNWDTARCHF